MMTVISETPAGYYDLELRSLWRHCVVLTTLPHLQMSVINCQRCLLLMNGIMYRMA
jgi:hypothetical protein